MLDLCLDGGHGARQPGCIAFDGTTEAELTAEFVDLVAKELSGYQVNIIKTRNPDKEYWQRSLIECDAYISIHFNACESHKGRGTETFYNNGDFKSSLLATSFNRALSNHFSNRGIKIGQPWWYCFEGREYETLSEICFVDNKQEFQYYNLWKSSVVMDFAKAVTDFFGILPNNKYTRGTLEGQLAYTNVLKRHIEHAARSAGILSDADISEFEKLADQEIF